MLALLAEAQPYVPNLFWTWPFVAILLAIAILPLLRTTHHWWEENRNKLIISVVLAVCTLAYYQFRGTGYPVHEAGDAVAEHIDHAVGADAPATSGPAEQHTEPHDDHESATTAPATDEFGASTQEQTHAADNANHASGAPHDGAEAAAHPEAEHGNGVAGASEHGDSGHGAHAEHRSEPGFETVLAVLNHAVLMEYVPFLTLLFALYVIAGGIVVRGDIQATPMTNTTILGIGGLMASFIGTTGAAMVLIRLLLKTNAERKHKVHTVVFFIFIVANIGGSLLPIGDPPLFLGYLRGVEFFWTFNLLAHWAAAVGTLLVIYWVWDTLAFKSEKYSDLIHDRMEIEPIRVAGLINFVWLLGVVGAVATLDPAKPFPGTNWYPPMYMREGVQLLMVGLSWVTTSLALRKENQFNFVAIGEVACLFIGIFITMQVPIEILQAKGAELGLNSPWQFFWATGMLSSFLDNAPTYVVFFETATTLPIANPEHVLALGETGRTISEPLLVAISCGAVFMGANSYIGNGPNFMVKSIAEQGGVKMPSFFGYMVYSLIILVPVFIGVTLVFFIRWTGA